MRTIILIAFFLVHCINTKAQSTFSCPDSIKKQIEHLQGLSHCGTNKHNKKANQPSELHIHCYVNMIEESFIKCDYKKVEFLLNSFYKLNHSKIYPFLDNFLYRLSPEDVNDRKLIESITFFFKVKKIYNDYAGKLCLEILRKHTNVTEPNVYSQYIYFLFKKDEKWLYDLDSVMQEVNYFEHLYFKYQYLRNSDVLRNKYTMTISEAKNTFNCSGNIIDSIPYIRGGRHVLAKTYKRLFEENPASFLECMFNVLEKSRANGDYFNAYGMLQILRQLKDNRVNEPLAQLLPTLKLDLGKKEERFLMDKVWDIFYHNHYLDDYTANLALENIDKYVEDEKWGFETLYLYVCADLDKEWIYRLDTLLKAKNFLGGGYLKEKHTKKMKELTKNNK